MGSTFLMGIFIKLKTLCTPGIVKESHKGGLVDHFGVDKTLTLTFLKNKFYMPHRKVYVQWFCSICIACHTWKYMINESIGLLFYLLW